MKSQFAFDDNQRLFMNFVESTEWGILGHEFLKYGIEQCKISENQRENFRIGVDKSLKNLKKKYTKTPPWREIAISLLQYGKGSKFLDRGSGIAYRNRLRNANLQNATRILAQNMIFAYARLFIEIEEDIKELIYSKKVKPACGYSVLKFLRDSKMPASKVGIMNMFRQAQKEIAKKEGIIDFERHVLGRLVQRGFIVDTKEGYVIHPMMRKAFEHADVVRKDVLKWKYRDNWFLSPNKK